MEISAGKRRFTPGKIGKSNFATLKKHYLYATGTFDSTCKFYQHYLTGYDLLMTFAGRYIPTQNLRVAISSNLRVFLVT